jgi:regulator of RNase E activity RraA
VFLSVSADNVEVAPPWDRPQLGWLDRLSDVPAAIAGDVLGRMTVMDGGIRLRTSNSPLLGFALPVHVRSGDNLAIHRALDEAHPGDVLVVNGQADTTRAVMGDLIGEIMVGAEMRGAVVDGAVRDVDALNGHGLSVYAREVSPAGPFKDGPGSVGYPVAVGGIVVAAGDLLIGDSDGVVVVPASKIEHVALQYETVLQFESELRSRIRGARSITTVVNRCP